MKNIVKKKRNEQNLRLVDLALKAGIGVSTLWLVEQGYHNRILLSTKDKIAEALHTDIKILFGEENER